MYDFHDDVKVYNVSLSIQLFCFYYITCGMTGCSIVFADKMFSRVRQEYDKVQQMLKVGP